MSPHTRVRLWGSILWNIIWCRLRRRGAGGDPGGQGTPLRTISRLDFSGGRERGGQGGLGGGTPAGDITQTPCDATQTLYDITQTLYDVTATL